eukprot:60121-Pelagomonas_calceolata.AAC.1
MLHTEAELIPPAIDPLSSLCQASEVLKYKETSIQKLAKAKTASHTINAIFYYDFDITHIGGWRNCSQ